ncbi:MAG: copper amine oxidase N-terminal domain-containing protein [Moorellales bacterium]
MRKFWFGILVGLLTGALLATTGPGLAAQPIKLVVNGREVACDPPPQVIGGRVFVPIRFVAEALGAKVEWQDQTVFILTPDYRSPKTESSTLTSEDLVCLLDLLKQYNGENVNNILVFRSLGLEIVLPAMLEGLATVKQNGKIVAQVYTTIKSGRSYASREILRYFP